MSTSNSSLRVIRPGFTTECSQMGLTRGSAASLDHSLTVTDAFTTVDDESTLESTTISTSFPPIFLLHSFFITHTRCRYSFDLGFNQWSHGDFLNGLERL
jgi:hypothetical protein